MKRFFIWLLRAFIVFLARFFFRPKVYYVDASVQKRRLKEPSLLVSNHINHLDGPVIGSVFAPAKIHYLAAKDRFENKSLARLMTLCRCIPIDRKDLDTSWIHNSLDILRNQKEPLCIFPEGRHGKNGEILPFHSGITTLAVLSNAPLLLIYIDGPYQFVFGKRLKMIIDVPMHLNPPTQGLTADYIQQESDRLRERMLFLQQELHRQLHS